MRKIILSLGLSDSAFQTRNAVLTAAGYGIIPANAVTEARHIINGRRVDAIVIGPRLPESDTLALAKVANEQKIPAVVLHAGHVLKPVRWADANLSNLDDANALLETIQELLEETE